MTPNTATKSLRILAFEPFDGGSHRAIRELITRHSQHQWTWLMRPARAWKWRMRLAAIEMIHDADARGVLQESFDAVFVTSLMSASDLRGCLTGGLRLKPLILYMHENQAAYPGHPDSESRTGDQDVHFALTNLSSVLAADVVLWNSQWNQTSFVQGVSDLLRHAPDLSLGDWQQAVARNSMIARPPVEIPTQSELPHDHARAERPVRVVWPHRWEHDKGPDELLRLAREHSEAWDLRWTILGERFRTVPEPLLQFETEFHDRIDHFGFEPDRRRYWQRLASCDWVLSTARHEFFGMAVAEALLAGCMPWVPNRLSYPELLSSEFCGLNPGLRLSQPERAAIRTKIREQLDPCRPPVAVNLIDRVIDEAVCRTTDGG